MIGSSAGGGADVGGGGAKAASTVDTPNSNIINSHSDAFEHSPAVNQS
jgi:hypothetical protein